MTSARGARATILLVEDDSATARAVTDVLEDAGYAVWLAPDAVSARHQVSRAEPDLILLDLILPDGDGLVLCYTLKASSEVPIIVLSATRRQRDPTLALRLGADDFVHKPFEVDHLLARIEAVLRRVAPTGLSSVPQPQAQIRVGPLLVEPMRRRAVLGEQPLALTPTEFRLLVALASHAEVALTREQLAREVWGYLDASHGRTIDVHVRRLRLKLLHCQVPGITILSVRGSGYKLSARGRASTAA